MVKRSGEAQNDACQVSVRVRGAQIQSSVASSEPGFPSYQAAIAFTWNATFPGGSFLCLVGPKTRLGLGRRGLDSGAPGVGD